MREAVKVSNDSPVLLDRFLSDATEVDVDAASDGEHVLIGGGDFAVDAGGDEVGGGFAGHTAFGRGASPTLRVNFSRSICRAWVRRALIVAAEHSSILAKS